jgi:hypothetical protein
MEPGESTLFYNGARRGAVGIEALGGANFRKLAAAAAFSAGGWFRNGDSR